MHVIFSSTLSRARQDGCSSVFAMRMVSSPLRVGWVESACCIRQGCATRL